MSPVALYFGRITHARSRPKAHRFAYSTLSILIDLDRLTEAGRLSPFFSVNRPNLVSFHERDHDHGHDCSLREHVDNVLKGIGLDGDGLRVRLLCYPRVLGFVFNPLSAYFAYRPDETLAAIIYEVRNTFGERHTYATAVEDAAGEVRHGTTKAFHVSPFLGMDLVYRFRLRAPEERLRLTITAEDGSGPILVAGLVGERRKMTTANLLHLVLRVPFSAHKVITAIHWQALRLWLKGVPVHPHPRRKGRSTAAAPLTQAGRL